MLIVDEVQKSENIFDALKYAFDHSNISFIVTGSNPAYLSTVAKKRLRQTKSIDEIEIPKLTLSSQIQTICQNYLKFGGLPLALLAESTEDKLAEIRLTVERGFELMSHENSNLDDVIRIELAHLQSKEFTYKNILEKTRLRRREIVNKNINELLNHGYVVKNTPASSKQ